MHSREHAAPVEGLRRIVLAGFMGSGKTTIGRLLAARIGWHFADLDHAIEELLGRSIPEIFAEQGEAAFRSAELDALRKLLSESRIVIALGGGALEAPGLHDLLAGAPETANIYLQGSFETLYQRCAQQSLDPSAVERPLLRSRAEAEQRYRRRLSFYEGLAAVTVNTESATPDDLTAEILTELGPQLLLP